MTKMEIVKEILNSPIACAELKQVANDYLDSVGTANESKCAQILIAEAEEDLMTNENVVAFFGSDKAKEIFGDDKANEIFAHHKQLLADGVKYCDCSACTAAKNLLDNRELF